jgi:chemotaxis protein methyltransferase CheR
MFETGYDKFKKDIYALTKIDLNAYKEKQMKRRIDNLITKRKMKTYDEYVAALKVNPILFDEFVSYLTINVSEFYRNPEQWDYLEKKVFPDLISKYGHGIKIWSAACSTGDEPYSLVMLLSKFLPLDKIKILATDIDEQVIAKAKVGIYEKGSLKALPEEFIKKYFVKLTETSYQIKEEIKKCV